MYSRAELCQRLFSIRCNEQDAEDDMQQLAAIINEVI